MQHATRQRTNQTVTTWNKTAGSKHASVQQRPHNHTQQLLLIQIILRNDT